MSRNKGASDLARLLGELTHLTERIAEARTENDARAIKQVRQAVAQATRRLEEVAVALDPVLRPSSVFDPSEPTTAGRIVALTLVAQPSHPLAKVPDFYGAGVYAIYYRGDFSAYSSLSNHDHPIYVGKADPQSSNANNVIDQGRTLSSRLREHAKSIRAAKSTLNLDDFTCRFLVTQSGFQKSAEEYLIHFFRPIWNSETKICFGLGKHGDSSKTRVNKRSPWDTMHPGRKWAVDTTEDQKPREQIIREIAGYLLVNPPFRGIHQIFDAFIQEMRQLSPDLFVTPEGGMVGIEEAGA